MVCAVVFSFSGESSHGWSWCRFVEQYSTSRNTSGRFRFYVKKTQNYIHQSPSARTTMLLNCSACWFHTAIHYHTRWVSCIRTLCLLQTLLEVDEDADFSRTGSVRVRIKDKERRCRRSFKTNNWWETSICDLICQESFIKGLDQSVQNRPEHMKEKLIKDLCSVWRDMESNKPSAPIHNLTNINTQSHRS